ncbi:MAG TPA: polysaccharide biosynthesis C-terminal domain-containing protein, partial [Acidimicrobiales bacterium]|nr:polysaccharide biosynthesis C-terminal domain-containing protein [Acidimicrobiales bacterium]
RILSDSQFGLMAAGLAFFVVFAGIGDLGTTRTIVRHVAGDHASLWPTFRRAVPLRIAGGLGTALVVAGIVALLPVSVPGGVVLLAGLIATASGVTELGYAGLRSIGRVRVETTLLVVERAVFLAIALVVLDLGGGAVAVLLVYLATNTVSALVASWAVWRARPATTGRAGPLLDGEGRYTAASFAIVTVGPQIGPVLLALFATATAVGLFSVAQSPIEGMTLFALSTAAPLLPILRAHLTAGRRADAAHAAVSVVTALTVAMIPVLVWFEVSPSMVLRLFYGAGRYEGAQNVLRLLAVTALAWAFRGVAEFVLLGEERARRFLWITVAGAVVTIAAGIPLVVLHEAVGAAIAVLLGEALMMVALLVSAPTLADRVARRAYAPVALAIVASAVVLVVVRSSTLGSVVAVVVLEVVCGWKAVRSIRAIERRA